jgi:5-(hydroxymethyl)furfural/furfural oxidase
MNDASPSQHTGATPDYLIVGGGSAGCALAARLSEDADVNVLLIEAGPDLRDDSMPEPIRSSYPSRVFFTREYFFPELFARFGDVQPGSGRNRVKSRYEQARVLGGGSTINGLNGNRGAPTDYEEWVALGARGWGWAEVLPYFRKLERDLDFGGELHGADGPIPIRRPKPEQLSGFVRHTMAALKERGFEEIDDQNGAWRDGVMRGAVTVNEAEHRASAAVCYLTPTVRARPNLRILTDTQVLRLVIEGSVVLGVDVASSTGPVRMAARETVVCCGAIHTPALLLRSGLGPAQDLGRAGVAVVRDIPGVGRNLREHPALGISCFVKPGQRHVHHDRHHTQAHLRFSSGLAGCPQGDMNMAVLGRSAWHRVGEQLATFYVWVNKAYSQGQVSLQTADPATPLELDFRMLSDERDLKRMREGFRTAASIALDSRLDAVRLDVFPTVFSDRVRKVSRPGAWNAFQTATLAAILDYAGFARTRLIRRLIASVDLRTLLADDAMLDEYLHQSVVGVWHAVGTCRMGAKDDPMAVTDSEGRVRGIGRLRICDASLMPSVPCANTNLPTLMVAERIADLIKAGRRKGAERDMTERVYS